MTWNVLTVKIILQHRDNDVQGKKCVNDKTDGTSWKNQLCRLEYTDLDIGARNPEAPGWDKIRRCNYFRLVEDWLIRKYPFEIKLITLRSSCNSLYSRQSYSCISHVMSQGKNARCNRKIFAESENLLLKKRVP